jgi:hypothetical protein
MEQTDRPEFIEHLLAMAELYNRALSDAAMEAYFESLIDLPLNVVTVAMAMAPGRCEFFPLPVRIREIVEGSPDDQAQQAWNVFLEATGRAGGVNSVLFEDRAIGEAIRQTFGSWPEACDQIHGRVPKDSRTANQTQTEAQKDLRRPPDWEFEPVLSDEMVQARQKQFKANYRIARNKPQAILAEHLAGTAERGNSQLSPAFLARLANQRPSIWVLGPGGVREEKLKWDVSTGRLDLATREPLQISAPRAQKQLPASTLPETGPTEELQLALAAYASSAEFPGEPRQPASETESQEQAARLRSQRVLLTGSDESPDPGKVKAILERMEKEETESES